MSPVPVAIASSGFTWTTALMALLNLFVGGALVAFIRTRPQMREIAIKQEANLLEERAAEMASMRAEIADLKKQVLLGQEEVRLLRHDLANTNTAFDLFIERVKARPEEAAAIAQAVADKREEQRAQIEAERADLRRARLAAVAGQGPTA